MGGLIRNAKTLLSNASSEFFQRLRRDALTILEAALKAADPYRAVLDCLALRGSELVYPGGRLDLDEVDRVLVVGGGKAGAAMAAAVEDLMGDRVEWGLVNIPMGSNPVQPPEKIGLNEAGHPLPTPSGVEGVRRMLEATTGLGVGDLVVVLVSGGGSALLPQPVEGVSLEDLAAVTESLMRAGATIDELNAVRKHLSKVKGGQLARHLHPAKVLVLVVSDVVGDPLDTIASGPTAPDPTTFGDALSVLRRYGLEGSTPKAVLERLKRGVEGRLRETPKPGDPVFRGVVNLVVASNRRALEAGKAEAQRLGYHTMVLTGFLEGEAREVGVVAASIARELAEQRAPLEPPAALLMGGETTVTVKGGGSGGRNQELVLGAVTRLSGLPALLASMGTDGVDGPTPAAGAMADGATLARATSHSLNPHEALQENDSYRFFTVLGDTIETGPTGTNVNDLVVVLVDG